MLPLQRILSGVDPASGPSPAVARAAMLADATGAALRLASCVYEPHTTGERFTDSSQIEQSRAALVATSRRALDELAAPLIARGLAVSVAARWAYPAFDGLAAEAREFVADLLVTGSSRSVGAGHSTALTHSDWQLIRHSPCPVLLTRGEGSSVYREILVAVDPLHAHDRPAALDDALVALAVALATSLGARLRLLHCYLPPEYVPFRAPGAVSAVAWQGRPTSMDVHRAALQALARRHALPESAILLEPADPRDAIPDIAARLGVDLVVMGAVARSRVRSLLIGSTTEPVLDRLGCDVLVVKPAGTPA